jgi:nicotinamide-nucleotide amidase
MNSDDKALVALARRVGAALGEAGSQLTTAESCTGGWIAKLLTDIPGSSAWFHGGFVTYSNRAKSDMLGVPEALIDRHGAVSREVVEAMATGARQRAAVPLALSVSGIAGPGGGTPDKPVGTVWFAWAGPGDSLHSIEQRLAGDRESVRRQSAVVALQGVLAAMGGA